ncbi:MAG: response regulator [Hoeflea sp.]|nr:response regulator [Hoeflea sp.]
MDNQRISVLIVEDEVLIRMSMVDELEDAGFTVFVASNADQAIEILIANSAIEVMFTDVDMPGGIDGLKLAASVRDRWPPIKIIVTSGHRQIDVKALPVEARFVIKPYDPMAIIRSIREMTAN